MLGKILLIAGTASVTAMISLSAPAYAQYYPQPPQNYPPQNYPPQQSYPPQQYYPPQQPQYGGITGALVRAYRYGQYPYGNEGYNIYGNERYGVDRCARAVEQRLNGQNYNWYGGNNYRRYRNFGRVEGITKIQRKNYGLKVSGVASSGYGGYQGWNRPGYGNYGYSNGADLRFECKVYANGQIRDIDISRRNATWQGY